MTFHINFFLGKFQIGGLTMAGGYTNLDRVRPGGYRRFGGEEATPPPAATHQEQYVELDSEEEEEAPPSYQRGGGPVFYPGPPATSGGVRSPPQVATPTKVLDKGRNNPGILSSLLLHKVLYFISFAKFR